MPATFPTEDEMAAFKESILLSMLLTVFDRDKRFISESPIKTKKPYLAMIENAMGRAHADLMEHKRLLRNAGFKIIQETRGELDLKVNYICRGYTSDAVYLWSYLAAEIEVRMMKYLAAPQS